MDEARLIDKLRRIEAIFAGATTEGEKVAAERARSRILEKLKLWEKEDPPVEYRFSMSDMWSRKVLVALLRRYGIRPFRYIGQRYTTVIARVSKRFVDETLWPEFQEISDTLRIYLSDVTDRVVHQVIHRDSSEAEVIEKPKQLPPSVGRAGSGPESAGQSAAASGEQQGRHRGRATGLFTMIEDHLALPFRTHVLGGEVTVVKVDLNDCDDVVAICKRGRERQALSILDLPLPNPRPEGWEWIEAFCYWARGGRVVQQSREVEMK